MHLNSANCVNISSISIKANLINENEPLNKLEQLVMELFNNKEPKQLKAA